MSYFTVRNLVNFDYIDNFQEGAEYDVAKECTRLLWQAILDSLEAYGLDVNAEGRTNVLSWVSVGDNGVEIEAGTYTRYKSDPDKLNALFKELFDGEYSKDKPVSDNSKIVEYFANNEEGIPAGNAYPKIPEVEMTIDEFVKHLCVNYKTSKEKFMCRVVL